MSSSTIMEYMSRPSGSFTDIFKAAGRVEGHTGSADRGQQKVVCTPEVSLYQYNGGPPLAPPCPPLDDQDIVLDVPPNGFQCGVCGKSFQQKNTFQNHLRSHREGDDPYQCDICGKTFAVPARLTRHYRTHTGEKPYQCEYCNKSFSVKENLSVHRRIHTKERPYKCEVCERAFEHSGKLHRHMRIHTGERPHSCQICHKTFIQSGQLVIHMRTHTGEKPYVCKVCNKGFTCSKQLKVHTRTHTGEKPYSCDICGKSFGYNHVLKLHQVAHYGEKVYKCTLCNTTFNSKKALETHIKTHSSDSHPNPPLAQDLPQRAVEAPRMSPSSVSHARQHSDKENRESSDSEVSSLNSPTAESPRSPPSPVYILPTSPPTVHHFKASSHGGSGYSASSGGSMTSTNSNGTSLLPNIPYPMLPPGVQVHQAPQSRTTYLYVTSKLPQPPTLSNQGSITVSGSGGPGSESSPRNINFKGFGQTSSRATAPETSSTRDTNFHQTASVRDKVLASLEKFGYGINASSGGSDSNSSSGSSPDLSIRTKGIQITPVTNPSTAYYNFGRTKHDLTMGRAMGGREREFSKVTSQFPENLSTYSTISKQFSKTDFHYNPYSRSTQQKVRDRSRSPDNGRSYNYGSGGVLALALTCGSKAVVSQFSSSVSVTPVIPNTKRNSGSYTTPPYSNPDSPELCIDFSRRPGSYSPKDGQQSPTPSTTPRSTPGLSGESAEELSDDYHQERHNSMDSGKRFTSSYGPRKRSSLIMEKYAQETHPSPPSSPNSKESILSQRLRLSSVIQYAEKCT